MNVSELPFTFIPRDSITEMPEYKKIEMIKIIQINKTRLAKILTHEMPYFVCESAEDRDKRVKEIRYITRKIQEHVRKRYNTYQLFRTGEAYSIYKNRDYIFRDDVGLDPMCQTIKLERGDEQERLSFYWMPYEQMVLSIPKDLSDWDAACTDKINSRNRDKFDYIDNVLKQANKERVALEMAIFDCIGERVDLTEDVSYDIVKKATQPEVSQKIKEKYLSYLASSKKCAVKKTKEDVEPKQKSSRRKIRNVEKGGLFSLVKMLKDSRVGRFLQKVVLLGTTANTVNKYYGINDFVTKHVPQEIQAPVGAVAGMVKDVYVDKVPSNVINTLENIQSKTVSGLNVVTDLANTGAARIAPYISKIPVVSINERTIQMIAATAIAYVGVYLVMNKPVNILAKGEKKIFNQHAKVEGERY